MKLVFISVIGAFHFVQILSIMIAGWIGTLIPTSEIRKHLPPVKISTTIEEEVCQRRQTIVNYMAAN